MMKFAIFFTCLVALSSATNPRTRLSESINEFGVDFLKKTSLTNENVFFSSASISAAFAMLLAGSQGQSEEELLRTFKLDDLDNVHDRYNGILSVLRPRAASNESYELNMANRLIVAKGFDILEEYLRTVRDNYLTTIGDADFANDGANVTDEINSWVANQTQGLIKKIFNAPLDPSTKLVLINAIYFKGSWMKKFNPESTRNRTFYGSEENLVDFMYKRDRLRGLHYSRQNLTLIELPYIGNASMIILLPDANDVLENLTASLTADDIRQMTHSVLRVSRRMSELLLPKFKLETEYNLKQILPQMGLESIFNPGAANLTGITGRGGLFVSEALHKAVVDVDEEGTKAAAVTAIAISRSAFISPNPTPVYIVDRPFLFFIRDKVSGINLFAGKVSRL